MDNSNCLNDPDEQPGWMLPSSRGIGLVLGGRAVVGPQRRTSDCRPTLALEELGWERGHSLHDYFFADPLSV